VNHFQAWHQVNAATLWVATVAAVVVLAGIVVLLWTQLRRLQTRYERLMGDAEGNNLHDMLENHVQRVRGTLDRVDALECLTGDLQRTLGHSVQWVGMVRFNPFRDTGGDQSFAIALADAHGDGIVLSSLHRTDITRIYAKPLLDWKSTHSLTEEELEAIEAARRGRTPV